MGAGLIIAVSAIVPREGIPAFRAYEDAVLPLLLEFGAHLERRLRTQDGTRELHILKFPSEERLEQFRADPRRARHAHLLLLSGAKSEVTVMHDVA